MEILKREITTKRGDIIIIASLEGSMTEEVAKKILDYHPDLIHENSWQLVTNPHVKDRDIIIDYGNIVENQLHIAIVWLSECDPDWVKENIKS